MQVFEKIELNSIDNWLGKLRAHQKDEALYLRLISAVETQDTIDVTYVFFLWNSQKELCFKISLSKNSNLEIPSITPFVPAANWMERECYDLFGIHFVGHPNLKRILLPEDWVGHPLRKDYVQPQMYQEMQVPL